MSAEAFPPQLPRLSTQRALALGVLLPLTYALFGATWMGFVPLLPELTAAHGVERADGTLLITVISMAKSVVPILTGIFAARLGLRRALLGAGVLMVIGGAAPWAQPFFAVVALRFLLGVGGAMWVTLMGSVVLAEIPKQRRAIANAVNGVAVNVGVIVALAVTLPLAAAMGVKPALSLASVLTGVCVALLSLLGGIGAAQQKHIPLLQTLTAYARTLRLGSTWLLALAFCGPLALYLVLNTFLGTHLEQAFSLPRAGAMRWLSFMNLCGVPVALLAGVWLARRPQLAGPMLLGSAVLLPLGVVGAVLAPTDALRAVAFALAGAGTFLPVSPLITTMQQLPGQTPERLAMIFGTLFAVTYLVSAAVPTWLGSAVAHGAALQTCLLGAALLGLTPLCGLLLLRRSAPTAHAGA